VADADGLTGFPRTLRVSTADPKAVYRRVPRLIAIHERTAPDGWEVVLTLEDPPIVVCRGDAGALPRALLHSVTPVYALDRRGTPAVPTGLVLVRFRDGIAATGCGEAMSRAGYQIHDVLPYAPSAAWVKAASGGIPASLRGIPALESLPDVVHVEPQMVRRSAPR
jgi:hypothetical protein